MKRCTLLVLAAAASMVLACLGCGPDSTPVGAGSGPAPKEVPPGLAVAMAAQQQHTGRLMAIHGVVGTATGLDPSGAPAVVVYAAEPGVGGLPHQLDGVPVVVEVTGEIIAMAKPPGATGTPNPTAGSRVRYPSGCPRATRANARPAPSPAG